MTLILFEQKEHKEKLKQLESILNLEFSLEELLRNKNNPSSVEMQQAK